MECRPLKITVISAKGLKDVNVLGKMDVYVDVSLSGDDSNEKHRTPIHKGGSTNPQWGHTLAFTFDEAAGIAGRLKFKIKAERILRCDKEIGEVDVPVWELLEKGSADDGEPKVLSYGVRLPSGKTKGVLKFSYEFGEQFTFVAPPLAKKADEPLMGYPAAEAPPASNLAAAYRPPVHVAAPYPPAKKADEPLMGYPAAEAPPASNLAAAYRPPVHGAAPYPPLGGYPPAGYLPQGYGYLSNAAPNYGYPLQGYGYPPAGYGYVAPPPAYQKPPKKNGGKNFVLGPAGKFLGVVLIKDMISDVWESMNNAG